MSGITAHRVFCPVGNRMISAAWPDGRLHVELGDVSQAIPKFFIPGGHTKAMTINGRLFISLGMLETWGGIYLAKASAETAKRLDELVQWLKEEMLTTVREAA